MNKFSYLKINKFKKIRYSKYNQKNATYIVFLHGFMSDLEGKKPKAFLNFAKKNKLGFLALEYSGHGKSSGKFTNGNITKWTRETTILIKKIVKKNRIILVGSSMGSWISLNQFKFFKKQIIGFLGIGSAPQFLDGLMWNKFSKKMKKEITQNKIINLKHGNYEYPISLQLIKDGRKNKVLNKKIYDRLKVTMVHGEKDESVPISYSKKVLKIFVNSEKKLVIVKNGDHSLSSSKWLNILKKELEIIIN
ncbi:alpha/beta hydrolase [Candidatus Pelagibacter sp. RS39]|uniref:alpha/beta hydrolase n=1 Tax=Candidatus Pelagibacter sp. RS39 TaxID=1977864 RepID=UPI0012ED417B|nr:alpha/beta hydrolase [Candidatus Pelagibacter sp. RS39]